MVRRKTTLCALALCAGLAAGAAAAAEPPNWPRFRGPNGSGLAEGDGIPVKWTEADYAWKVKLPGAGHGSPAVWGDRVFLFCCDEKTATRIVVCLNAADGSTVWTRPYVSAPYTMHRDNTYAGATPTVDARGVYVAWATPQKVTLLAMDHDGKELWQLDLGPYRSQHGPCLTTMAFEDLVILPNVQQGDSYILAVEAATGKMRWKLPVPPEGAGGEARAAYGTPCIYQPAGGGAPQVIITSTAGGIAGIEARTGKLAWEVRDAMPQRCVGSPAIAGDLLVASCGTGGAGVRMVAARPTADGKGEIAWEMRSGIPYVPTPLCKGDKLFVLTDSGGVACLKPATGQKIWQDKLPDRFYGSFVCVGDRLYCISRKGTVYVLSAGDKFELLAEIPLDEPSSATPAVAGGRMFLKTNTQLFCLGARGDRP